MSSIGKTLIVFGAVLMLAGVVCILFAKYRIPFFGRLPGDIMIERKNFVFYFPLATSIVMSVILSLVFYFFSRK